jgi:hypothetical protein
MMAVLRGVMRVMIARHEYHVMSVMSIMREAESVDVTSSWVMIIRHDSASGVP